MQQKGSVYVVRVTCKSQERLDAHPSMYIIWSISNSIQGSGIIQDSNESSGLSTPWVALLFSAFETELGQKPLVQVRLDHFKVPTLPMSFTRQLRELLNTVRIGRNNASWLQHANQL